MARRIDHTLVRAHATEEEVRQLCAEAAEHGFRAVSVNPAWVTFCAKLLRETHVVVDACVAFPLGAATARMKVEEAKEAVQNGARELDMVINIGALKSGYPDFVEREIAAVAAAVRGVPVKVILEAGCLNRDEKIMVCEMAVRAGAGFVKTATGFGQSGATVEDVALMRETVGDRLGVKAAGGIRTWGDAVEMLRAGASVIGTSTGAALLLEGPEAGA